MTGYLQFNVSCFFFVFLQEILLQISTRASARSTTNRPFWHLWKMTKAFNDLRPGLTFILRHSQNNEVVNPFN
jgi:hypothetical protein